MEVIDESPVEVWSAGSRRVAARLLSRCPIGHLGHTLDPSQTYEKPLLHAGAVNGQGGIRTRGTPDGVRRFSKPVPSAARPPVQSVGL
jgi:hypothetical protein